MTSRPVQILPALICLAAAAAIAGVVYFAGPQPVLHDTAAVTRIPVPGEATVTLPGGNLGLYFGRLDAPMAKVMAVPSLSINIVPPPGVQDPAFTEVAPRADVYVDGYHTVQVARIDVAAGGIYQISVQCAEQSGGSFSVGDPPEIITPGQNVLRAWPLIGLFLGLGTGAYLWQLARRRRRPFDCSSRLCPPVPAIVLAGPSRGQPTASDA